MQACIQATAYHPLCFVPTVAIQMQQARRHIPLAAIVGHDADRLFVQAQDDTLQPLTMRRLKPYAITHRKAAHEQGTFACEMGFRRSTIKRLRNNRSSSSSRLIASMGDTRSTIFTLPGFMTESMPSSV
ncbi:hypothetical protein O4G98_10730 [Zoogloeaceae bacterium G21618-S1]|nr:hypothetical protein [Zoogloeaceae bacterium G21618-S1]